MIKKIIILIATLLVTYNANAQKNKRPVDYADVFIGTSNSRWEMGPYAYNSTNKPL